MGKRYFPSNRCNIPLLLLFFIVGTLLSSVVSILATLFGLWLIPPYAGIVLAFLAAGCIYWIQLTCTRLAKNRNLNVARISILITSLIAAFLHIAAVPAIELVMGTGIRSVSMNLTLKTLQEILVGSFIFLKQPAIPFRTFTQQGGAWILYLVFSIAAIVLIPQLAAEQAKQPFSEAFNQWMKKVYSVGRIELIPDREQRAIVSAMKVGDITPFLRRPRYSSQVSDDYTVLTFYKVKNAHTGYVGVENFHQSYDNKNRPTEGQFHIIEFIPPMQIGEALSEQLETAINISSGAMAKNSGFAAMIPEPSTTLDIPEEYGYKLYRTTEDSPLTFDSEMLEHSRSSESLRHYRRSPSRDLSESFQYYAEESQREEKKKSSQVKKGKVTPYNDSNYNDYS